MPHLSKDPLQWNDLSHNIVSPLEQAKLTIKTGDSWNYSPWGGQCFAHFVAGVLKVYRADRGPNTVQCAWQCQSAEDTRELLAGLTVQVIWDGVDKKNCKLTKDLCGFTVQHGTTWYDFTKDVSIVSNERLTYLLSS